MSTPPQPASRLVEPPEAAAFRQRLRAWLEANLPSGWLAGERPHFAGLEDWLAFHRGWHRQLHEGGWIAPAWPRESGGMGLGPLEQAIYNQEMARAQTPTVIAQQGLNMLGPTLMRWGSAEQKARYLPKILSAEEIWCQGYSEPNAGSDLASLQTRAVEDGDDFVVTGQKIWTSYAHFADWMFLLVRTDPAAPKHKGISYLLVDMHSPGITVRPLRQITGHSDFNETFLDTVRVPKANLVGEKNRGWYVAVATLTFERSGLGETIKHEERLRRLVALARRTPAAPGSPYATAWDDPRVRQRIAQVAVELTMLKRLGEQVLAAQVRGETPGAEASVMKLFASEFQQRLARTGLEIVGPYGTLLRGSPHAVDGAEWPQALFWGLGLAIGGGSSEIQRNIIGERALGLPKG